MPDSTEGALLYADPFTTPKEVIRYDAGEVLAALEGALVNRNTGMGSPFSAFHETRVGQTRLLSEQELRALYRSNWWVRRIIDTPAFDMTRKGIDIKLTDDDDTELVSKVLDKYNDTNPTDSPFESEYSIDQAKAEAIRWARQFGRAYIVVRCNKGEDPSKPLKRVRSFDGITVLDCYQLQPALEELNSYNPTYYQVSGVRDASNKDRGNDFTWGQRIHKSRVLPYDGNRIHPYDVQVDGTGGHDSVIQCMFEIFTRYYQCNESVAEAMQSFSLFVANINNLSAIISGRGGVQKLQRYLQELNTQRSVYRTVVQDGQSSSGDFVERSFAGVAENIKHFADEVTAATDLPHYKIWGSESNTNAISSGGAESRAYAEKITGWQFRDLHPNDRRLFKMLFAEHGDIPRFTIEYPSIYQPTPQEEEEIKAKQADRYATLAREKIILPLHARLALATEQDIANVLNADEIQEELEQSKALAEKELDLEETELEQSIEAANATPEQAKAQAGLSSAPENTNLAPGEEAAEAEPTGEQPRTVNGQVVPDLDEVALLLDDDSIRIDEWVWRTDKKKGKKRNCRKGLPCGNSCIARSKTCRKKPTGVQKQIVQKIRNQVVPLDRPEPTQASLTDRPNTGSHKDIPSGEIRVSNVFVYTRDKSDGKYYKITQSSAGKEKKREEITKGEYTNTVNSKFKGNPQAAALIGEDARPPDVVSRLQQEARAKQVAAMSANAGIDEQQASQSLDAIKSYSSADNGETGYTNVRKVQRGDTEGLSASQVQKINQSINDINQYIENAPTYKGNVYRGLNFESQQDRDAFLQQIQGGYQLEAMSSFTSSKAAAKDFAPGAGSDYGVIFAVSNKSGVSIRGASEYKDENEVLVPKGARYRIVDTKKQKNNTLIQLEELD